MNLLKIEPGRPRKRFILVLGLLVSGVSFGQPYSVDWYKIAGGGGISSGGAYDLSGTIGQHGAGTMTGGNFTLIGGFWSLVAEITSPGTPALTFAFSPTNSILVCWPSGSTNFVLQQNAGLRSTNWVNIVLPLADNGSIKCAAITPSRGTLFFRLKK